MPSKQDIYGRRWPPKGGRRCPLCGQPETFVRKTRDDGTCSHEKIERATAGKLGAELPDQDWDVRPDWQFGEPLYVRRGRRFHPVACNELVYPHSNGHWLVSVHNGCSSFRQVEPARAPVLAALKECRDAMTNRMSELPRLTTPVETKLSVEHDRAWKEYRRRLGANATMTYYLPSMADTVDAGIAEVEKRIKEKST